MTSIMCCIVVLFFMFASSYIFFLFINLSNPNCLLIVVELLFYAPVRPVVEFSVAILWLMSVATVACASLWSEIIASEQTEERYNELSPKVLNMLPLIFLLYIHP